MRKGKGKSDKWLMVIGSLKLLKGVLLVLVAIGALRLIGGDAGTKLENWCHHLNVDADNRWLRKGIEKLSDFSSFKMSALSAGTFIYAALFLIEGTGLLLKKRWAEYFTVIVTGSFLPLEIYELLKEFKPFRLVLIIVNAAIVVYLVWRLVHERKAESKKTG